MRLRQFMSAAAFFVAATLLAGCGDSSGGGPASVSTAPETEPVSNRIYLLTAESGHMVAETTPEDYTQRQWRLTLEAPDETAFWYSDRPERDSGTTALARYVDATWQSAYGETPPHATLQFLPEFDTVLESLYVALSGPQYDAAAGTVSFSAKVLDDTIDLTLPERFEFTAAVLNVLNNAEDDVEVASYVQYADNAALRPSTTSGGLELVMTGTGPDMLWVDNAPGTYSSNQTVESFMLRWQHLFADNPPNAALAGTTPTGATKLYFVTLTDPVYDPAAGELRYTATPLDTSHGALEMLTHSVLLIDSGPFTRFPLPGKGVAYQPFSFGYNPSQANSSELFFGSDIARKEFGSYWGTTSYLRSQSCAPNCRNDLKTLRGMNVNLIRLYDWDPRQDHSQFLNHAKTNGITVLASISNWLAETTDVQPSEWAQHLEPFFNSRNFAQGNNWHPAIAGITITNELDRNPAHFHKAIGLIAEFLRIADSKGFSKSVLVCAPVTFEMKPNDLPAWHSFRTFLNDPRLAPYQDRLMLCPNAYNSKEDLFDDFNGTGQGWVQQTYREFGKPILFTELGLSRTENYYTPEFIRDQLKAVIAYQKQHPEQLLGATIFQFSNKVWMQTPDDSLSEGAFGMFRHGAVVKTLNPQLSDFDPLVAFTNNPGTLVIDALERSSTYYAVEEAYRD
ncbi:hypothetical protein G5B41_15290 [bacterium SGD-2]|nr:hypothetical protein [bacterium SGD-2]